MDCLASSVAYNGSYKNKGIFKMTQNIWLAFPSLTALLIQLWILLKSNKRTLLKENKSLIFLFSSIAIISAIEFATYAQLLPPSLILMKTYYAACFLGMAGIFFQALKISGFDKVNNNLVIKVISITCAFLVFLVLNTNFLISGFEFISYSYTREAGQFYWLVQIYLISTIVLSLALLLKGTKNKIKTNARRSMVLLVAITPFLVIALMTLTLMQFGVKFNASIIFPIMITYFLLALLQLEKEESLFVLLMKLPFSKERESFNLISTEIKQFLINTELSITNGNSDLSLKSLTSSIENMIVEHAVSLNQGSQVKAASLLGISSSSICRKKKKQE